jgi:hypothetical protein
MRPTVLTKQITCLPTRKGKATPSGNHHIAAGQSALLERGIFYFSFQPIPDSVGHYEQKPSHASLTFRWQVQLLNPGHSGVPWLALLSEERGCN